MGVCPRSTLRIDPPFVKGQNEYNLYQLYEIEYDEIHNNNKKFYGILLNRMVCKKCSKRMYILYNSRNDIIHYSVIRTYNICDICNIFSKLSPNYIL